MWAPRAARVALVLGDREVALQPGERGWHAATTSAAPGQDYAFRLDGGPERPDPASRWQPDGVHGRSRLYDVALPDWTDQGWRAPALVNAVVYELHVGTFTSDRTLEAAAAHLDDLVDLGVTHVELLPLNAFNGTAGWGYDGVLWYCVHEPYGGPAALVRFVDAAHARGLAVILDAVYNHLGPSGNYLGDFGPYLSDRYRTPWGDCLNLDGPGSDAVRAFIIGSALAWLTDFHIDALRLDAVHGLIDTSSVHVLAQLADAVAARQSVVRRPLALIAESDRNDPLTVTPRALGGQGLDGQWVDDLHHAIHTAITGEDDGYYADYAGLVDVAAAYERGFVYDGRWSRHRGTVVGAPPVGVPGWRFVTCIQNHDQVGNRALGDRLTTIVDPALVRVAALLLCASPTTPMLFMGEEYGETAPFQYFTSHPEPELAEAVRAGRRAEFAAFAAFAHAEVPDPQDPATAVRSTLDRSLASTDEGRKRRALWRDLLALRREIPALGDGRRDLVEVVAVAPDRLALVRGGAEGPAVLVVANLAASNQELAVPPAPGGGRWSPLLSTADAAYGGTADPLVEVEGPVDAIGLPGRTAALLVQSPNAYRWPSREPT